MRSGVRIGFEREGSIVTLALRSPEGASVTLSAPVASFAAFVATLALGVQPDAPDGYELQIKGTITIKDTKTA